MSCQDGWAYWGFKNSRWRRKPWSSTTEMSWLSRAMNSFTFSVIFYCTKFVVLSAARLLPPHETVVLQKLHVAIGLVCFRFLIQNVSTLQTFYPQVSQSIIYVDINISVSLCGIIEGLWRLTEQKKERRFQRSKSILLMNGIEKFMFTTERQHPTLPQI